MLKPPHTHYRRIYTYHLEAASMPVIADSDLIGVWPEGTTFILFFHAAKSELIDKLCAQTGARLVYEADLSYADWETGFLPTTFIESGMTIAPIWEEKETEADLYIDPSVVFGNGFHPSTRLCLRQLLYLLDGHLTEIDSAVDLGCGTGLLAMAAAKRGVSKVKAVDNNPLCCQVALVNAVRNRVEDRIQVSREDLFSPIAPMQAALVIANLHSELLAHLMNQPAFWQARYYIISGFMPGDEERLLSLLPAGIRMEHRARLEKWCLWHLARAPLQRGFSEKSENSLFGKFAAIHS